MDEQQKRINEIAVEIRALKRKLEQADGLDDKQKILAEMRELGAERTSLDAEIAATKEAEAIAEATKEPEADEPKADADADAGEAKTEAADGEGEQPAAEAKPEAEAKPDADADAAEAKPEAEAEEAKSDDDAKADAEPEAIAAAVGGVKPKVTGEAPEAGGKLAITASATTGGLSRGADMETGDWSRLHKHAARAAEGRTIFASIERHSGSGRVVSSRNSAIENSSIMAGVGVSDEEIQPLTAAACYCGPFETMKDITTIGLDDRPVLGLFRTVPVTGPFNYIRELNIADVQAGVTQWECTDQDAVDPANQATWKPCVDLDCADPVQVDPYAIVACGKHDIFQQLSHPELIDDFIAKLGIRYARIAEQLLLDQLRADSTVLTYAATNLGLLWELEVVLGHIAGIAGYGQRINWSDYALILPPGFMEAIIADEHVRGFSRGANRADIMAQLRELGVGQIVESLDVSADAEAAYTAAIGTYIAPGTEVAFDPNTAIGEWQIHLVPLSSYTVGQSTLVDAGFTRDSQLIRQNKVQYFMEGAEFIEKMNDVPSFTVQLTGYGNGGRSALQTPDPVEL